MNGGGGLESTGDPEVDLNVILTREIASQYGVSYERAAVLVAMWSTEQKRLTR